METALNPKRAEAIERAKQAAWDERKDCPHCEGEGRIPGGRRLIHSSLGGFGANWDLEKVIDLIKNAESCQWIDGLIGHDLCIQKDGETYFFDIRRPGKENNHDR